MAITNQAQGTISSVSTTLLASQSPNGCLVKGLIIYNGDSIEHEFTVALDIINLTKITLKAGETLFLNSTISLGSADLIAYMSEIHSTIQPTFNLSYLIENETV